MKSGQSWFIVGFTSLSGADVAVSCVVCRKPATTCERERPPAHANCSAKCHHHSPEVKRFSDYHHYNMLFKKKYSK